MKDKMKKKRVFRYSVAPLPAGFTLTGLLGLIVVSIYTLYGRLDPTWGFTFILVFLCMFIASMLSITPSFPKELDKRKS